MENEKIKDAVDRLHGNKIIAVLANSSNTWFAHADEKQNDIITVDDICKSNLKEILTELHEIWRFYHLSLQK